MSVTIYGASDDLIEVEGDIEEEFTYGYRRDSEDDGDVLAFSDGTVLRVRYGRSGVWRITPAVEGTHPLKLIQAPEDNEDNHSDRATIEGPISWVVRGDTLVARRSS